MPKIRGFKPDLWTDEDFVEVSPLARLLWLGMWNYACDNGHLQDKSKQIKMRVLPTDDVNCADLLRELATQGLIERSDGWITVPNLTHHQAPHKRWWVVCEKPGCEYPEGASYGFSKRGSTVDQPLTNRGTPVDQPGNNGGSTADVDVDVDVELKGGDGDKPAARKRATQIPSTWQPNDGHRAFAAESRLDLNREAAQFRDHHQAKGSTMKDWDAAFRTWLRNGVKWRGTEPTSQPRLIPHATEIEQPPDGLTPGEYRDWHAQQVAKRRQA